jgi:hypothetical protein
MQRILVLKVLGTKFLHCSNFTAHMASANQNIGDAVGHTHPSTLSIAMTMLILPFNMQGIYINTTIQ